MRKSDNTQLSITFTRQQLQDYLGVKISDGAWSKFSTTALDEMSFVIDRLADDLAD